MATGFAKARVRNITNNAISIRVECVNGVPDTGFNTRISNAATYSNGKAIQEGDWMLVQIDGKEVLPGRIFPNDPHAELDTSVPGVGKGGLIDGMQDPNADSVVMDLDGNPISTGPIYAKMPFVNADWINAVPYGLGISWVEAPEAKQIPVGTPVFFYFEVEENRIKVKEMRPVEGECSLQSEVVIGLSGDLSSGIIEQSTDSGTLSGPEL